MRLSIIIPLYNVEDYLTHCIESLLNQNLLIDDYEILIIDDGSTDNSLKIAKSIASSSKNIKVYSKENGGVGSARNKGLDLAIGEYIYFIDPDDYLASNVLKSILENAEKSKLDVLTFVSLGTEKFNLSKSFTHPKQQFVVEKKSGIDFIGDFCFKNEVWWYIVKRAFVKKINLRFIEGRWMEDAIFTANLLTKTKKIGHLPLDAHRHVKVKGSAMTSREPSHYLKVIHDNANAAYVYSGIIEFVEVNHASKMDSIRRLKSRQQSFVFFLMVRMLKSTIKLKEAKDIISGMEKIKAYPLKAFLGKDYGGLFYTILVRLFNIKNIYFLLFLIANPILKLKK
ncbi:glycosyltransferase family 2 protein [Hyunsoonleella ulvae]|uniref:glycosyltransferase family 2 protein n=1 Tax=Hyunsoonleella ulvae TaxID=2799948 RepID=UPI001939C6DA|nr:glycosyltransferase [Hyunsoonleella ulvae]